MKPTLRTCLSLLGGAVSLFGLIQLVPVNRANPPVVTPVVWDSVQTEELFARACADCHTNETVWPAYAYVAPMSWLVARDVHEGRRHFNLSELSTIDRRRLVDLPEEIDELVREGEMPLPIYIPLHPEANLTAAEKEALIAGLVQTLANAQAGE